MDSKTKFFPPILPDLDKAVQRKSDSVQNKRNYRGHQSSSPETQRRATQRAGERDRMPDRQLDKSRERLPDRSRDKGRDRDREKEKPTVAATQRGSRGYNSTSFFSNNQFPGIVSFIKHLFTEEAVQVVVVVACHVLLRHSERKMIQD